ncbi:hypothetical protein SAMN02745126_05295 [Enhydrobacter aerosaccus]|uniref:Uncharacterized protein n=2 Tax=Enhydrobacter aerosaccus TaxID=225324 RepID=A0A1T4SWN8_9HYPH|nr:hypothetical protein SAMN02745126_05295 [Enhydrobacter aerosaccus]
MKFLWARHSCPLDSLWSLARETAVTIESKPMLDVILIAIGSGLFLVAIAYAYACDRL